MEAIVACTRNNAFAVGLEHDVGVVEAGRLADLIILKRDPLADIRMLQGGQHLAMVMKDGRIVALNGQEEAEDTPAYAASVWV
jgi:imidazolonepropionase-like amidohydrolase